MLDIDREREEYEYSVVLPESEPKPIKRKILMTNYKFWNPMTKRFIESEKKVVRKGRTITFEGTQSEFDDLVDELHSDEKNSKIIGIYEN